MNGESRARRRAPVWVLMALLLQGLGGRYCGLRLAR